jgi:hypothetical protein
MACNALRICHTITQVVDRDVGRVAANRHMHPRVADLYKRALASTWAFSSDQRDAISSMLQLIEADLVHTESTCVQMRDANVGEVSVPFV